MSNIQNAGLPVSDIFQKFGILQTLEEDCDEFFDLFWRNIEGILGGVPDELFIRQVFPTLVRKIVRPEDPSDKLESLRACWTSDHFPEGSCASVTSGSSRIAFALPAWHYPDNCYPANSTPPAEGVICATSSQTSSLWHCPRCGAAMIVIQRFTAAELSTCCYYYQHAVTSIHRSACLTTTPEMCFGTPLHSCAYPTATHCRATVRARFGRHLRRPERSPPLCYRAPVLPRLSIRRPTAVQIP